MAPDPAEDAVREVLEEVVGGLGLSGDVEIARDGETVTGTVNGRGTFKDATHFIQLKHLGGYTLVELKIIKSNLKAQLAIGANAKLGQTIKGVGLLTSVGANAFIGNVDLTYVQAENGKATLKK